MSQTDNSRYDDDHVFPPTALPASEISRYSPDRDPDREQDIARYVELEARDETVQHVELAKTEVIAGIKYEAWDVVTDKDHWWVIDGPTNLYSQRHFPSLDFTLSFHVGLMLRVQSRPRGAEAEESSPFEEVFRRQAQAKALFDEAIEPEDFQAVGVQLRECLLSLLPPVRRRVQVPDETDAPQEGNFIRWYEILSDLLCPGASNKELRQFLKHTGRDTWQLVSWLVHDRDANRTAALVAVQSTDNVIGHSIEVLERQQRDFMERCPVCGSRDVRSHYDPLIGDEGGYYSSCGACRWTDHPVEDPDPAA